MTYRYIYMVKNLLNGKSYIGQHTTEKEYDSYYGSGSELLKDMKKIGIYNFVKGIIEYCESKEELNEKEKFWITIFDTIENGYNICRGGGDYPILYGEKNGFFNKKHSEETKKKISEMRKLRDPWNKGRKGVQKASDKQKQIASERHSGEGNWNFGRKGELSPSFGLKRSKKTKKKLSESKKGAKNPNVAEFEILAPDGKCYHINYGIPEFIKTHTEYNVEKWVLYRSKKLGKEYKGWRVNKII